MQFYYAVALCFLGALIRHTAAESAVQLPTGPLFLPNNSTGAAVVVTSGYTRIYYLAPDGSIHELRGSGVPRPGAPYVDILRVPASKVRANSPLAAVELKKDDEDIRLYFVGADNYLKEYLIPALTDGDLNNVKYAVRPGSNFLYAVSVVDSYAPRVGYQCASGNLCEANYDSRWHTQEL
ncbi:hypothetical protein MMC29_000435 [Sticta canariensis]|nr:hypothetical protein [Sticta canariensis]